MTRPLARLGAAALAVESAITRGAVALGSLALFAAVSVGLYQVVARFVLFQPASWSEPLVQGLLIWMTYLALCGAMRTGTLISVDVLYQMSRGRARQLLRLVGTVAIFALLAVLLWFGAILCWKVRFQTIAGLNVSAAYAYAALPTGALLSMIALVARFFDPGKEPAVVPDTIS
ncbi:TRAP transporter small permease [Mangrovicella endophytica]|uniref:TRAP transporter small permease n=1 Tax=Mangrovicella endophytica TaxID=2066697 RepID=UPI0012FFF014|nr:TRAP transporter small permease [Mangrovicella endophytica]